MRTVFVGGPKSGKTTYAAQVRARTGQVVLHTDWLLEGHRPANQPPLAKWPTWSEASALVAEELGLPGHWIIEGVSTARALRKWMLAHEGDSEKPCDEVLLFTSPLETTTPPQVAMKKGVWTVWDEVEDELLKRGVRVEKAPLEREGEVG